MEQWLSLDALLFVLSVGFIFVASGFSAWTRQLEAGFIHEASAGGQGSL
jgi:hypothetical protein